jgi:hypothetical protein
VACKGQAYQTGGTANAFLTGFAHVLITPQLLLMGLAAGVGLLIYQFWATIPIGILGLKRSGRTDRATAVLLILVAAGDVTFLLGATDPSTGGEYVWNLHYYIQLYIVFALWAAMGFAALWSCIRQTRLRIIMAVLLTLAPPILVYAITPTVVRPFTASLPGFRQVGGRDNLTYVLSPWKQNETGARTFGESILKTLPPHSVLFADYSIWTIVNYLQVVESARPDVQLLQLPSVDSGQQLLLILKHRYAGNLFLADTGRYYDITIIQACYDIVPTGPIYRLIPK